MIELPYRKKFSNVPEIDKQELADYFNLELGLDAEENLADDFNYLGIFEVDGYERMFWSIKGKDICATVRPYEDTFIIEMDSFPNELKKS